MPRPFRFIAPMPALTQPVGRWRDALRRIEDLGFSTVSVSEHLTQGWAMEATAVMTAAAEATERLRILSLVLANDFHHPVLLHKWAATVDLLSDGRLELGLGTGWMRSDYLAAGIPFDPAPVRIARLEESLHVLKGLFGASPLTFEGAHYRVVGLEGLPKPLQQPHPPLLVGGGGRRMLTMAAREADIVGVHCNLAGGALTADAAADLDAQRVAEKVEWVRLAAAACSRPIEAIELQFSVYLCKITDRAGHSRSTRSSFADLLRVDAGLMERSPAVLVGSLEQCVEALQELRERYGFSYLNLGGDIDMVAPLVARLVGT
jgi:probable F420-dependent oxidoreductase